jgi:hypothetical protein
MPQEEALPVAIVFQWLPAGEEGTAAGGHRSPPGNTLSAAAPRPMRGVCVPQHSQAPAGPPNWPHECALVTEAVVIAAEKEPPLMFQHSGRGPLAPYMTRAHATCVSQKPVARSRVCPQPHTTPAASTACAVRPLAPTAPLSAVLRATPRAPYMPAGQPAEVTSAGAAVVASKKFWLLDPQQKRPLPLDATEMPHAACAPAATDANSTGEGTSPGGSVPAAALRPHWPNWQ